LLADLLGAAAKIARELQPIVNASISPVSRVPRSFLRRAKCDDRRIASLSSIPHDPSRILDATH